ncbi:ABC transporter substrate-binding protein [Hassallia byssoidea VB512170]|uniref:ABC transporter substrate-binding protein n=1 Tax=Hassallia byssoidea VB512170 TaxID=1304833 RepID=A0A846HE10_9CYAN|nr:ABC transporter substrate-binding protein [Hassalia byssoidea]NEU74914.1 ABC transporter substrate-binding protein [Hassalia byssoidea VB512170]
MSLFSTIFAAIWRFWLLVILVTTALIVFACNQIHLQRPSTPTNQLITSIVGEPQTFNAALNQTGVNIFGLTYEGLVRENPVTGIEPALAESWKISDDKLRIVFYLRSGLKWSDGKPLTADDVVFTYNNVYFNNEISLIATVFQIGIRGELPKVRKLDEHQVEFILPEPYVPFLGLTTAEVLPAHALEASVKTKDKQGKPMFLTKWGTDTSPTQLIVNGPYILERYDIGQRLVFRRNPHYWRKDAQGNEQPYIERIVWQIVGSTDTSLLQFRSGGLDVVEVEPQYFSLLKQQEKQGNYKIYSEPSFRPEFFAFNLNKAIRDGKPLVDPIKSRWFNTVEFRQAVAYAIDRQTMLNNTFQGLGKLEYSPILRQSSYYLSPSKGLKVYDYNPQKAKELLLKAGFKYNDKNQLLDAKGNHVRFTLITSAENKTLESMGAQIKQDLRKIGIQVDFVTMANNTLADKLLNSQDWETSLGALLSSLEPNDLAALWTPESSLFNFKPQARPKLVQGWQVADWQAEIGRLYRQAALEFDDTKRKAIYAKTQQLAQEYLPCIYLINRLEMLAVRDRFQPIKYSAKYVPLAHKFWNIYEIKVTQ